MKILVKVVKKMIHSREPTGGQENESEKKGHPLKRRRKRLDTQRETTATDVDHHLLSLPVCLLSDPYSSSAPID